MNQSTYRSLLVCFLVFCFGSVFSQTKTKPDSLKKTSTVIVRLKDGKTHKGQIIKRDDKTIFLQKAGSTVSLATKDVVSIDPTERQRSYKRRFEFANKYYDTYFLSPTALPVEKDELYYENTLLLVNFFNYNVTENISVGGGIEPLTALLGIPTILLKSKVGFKLSEKMYAGGGGIVSATITGRGPFVIGAGFGMVTRGSEESNLSVSAGYFFVGFADANLPTTIAKASIGVSGMHRVSNRLLLLSENYFLFGAVPPSDGLDYLGLHGIRILSRSRRRSLDLGLAFITTKPPIDRPLYSITFFKFVQYLD